MPRNLTLGAVRALVKAELSKSLQTASTAQDAYLNQLIEECQFDLAGEFDWPFLKNRWNATLAASSRYQAFPTANTLGVTVAPSLERPVAMFIKWNQIWEPIVYGIDEYPEFNYIDSDRSQILDPIQRWQFNDETQYEVWPMPASASSVRFVGQRALTSLQTGTTTPPTWNDSALLDLDSMLVAYKVAMCYATKEGYKPIFVSYLTDKYQRRLNALRGAYPRRDMVVTVGRGDGLGRQAIRQVPLVMVAANTKP